MIQAGSALPRVTVVIVSFNSSRVLGDCLASLPENVEVCLVDNASQDNSIELARQVRPSIQVMANRENLGFARAVNLGARQSHTEFVLLLNPDTRMAAGTIDRLVASADAYPDAAIVAPVLYHPDGEQQTSYRRNVFDRERNPGKYIEPEGDMCVEYFSGAVMLWRMSHLREIGLLDERFFFTYEDDDLCLRVRAAGRTLILTPRAKVTHATGTSTEPTAAIVLKKTRYVMTARLLIEQKYHGMGAARSMAAREAGKYLLRTLLYLPFLYKKGILRSLGRYQAAAAFLVASFRRQSG